MHMQIRLAGIVRSGARRLRLLDKLANQQASRWRAWLARTRLRWARCRRGQPPRTCARWAARAPHQRHVARTRRRRLEEHRLVRAIMYDDVVVLRAPPSPLLAKHERLATSHDFNDVVRQPVASALDEEVRRPVGCVKVHLYRSVGEERRDDRREAQGCVFASRTCHGFVHVRGVRRHRRHQTAKKDQWPSKQKEKGGEKN
mmetsp:Transcript_9105/g.23176  ORF Transcript_9105/g.23176 Transcript_9105/m.23176 type:complete len:201 (-) Transcript_9105:9-611(-)